MGVNKSFKHAIDLASSAVVVLCDQDDYWHENRLQVIHNRFLVSDAELLVVNADIEVDGEYNGKTVFDFYPPTNSFLRNFLKNRFTGCQMAFKRTLCAAINDFPPDNVCYYDHYLSLVALLRGRAEVVTERLGLYARHSSNVTDMEKSRALATVIKSRMMLALLMIFREEGLFSKSFRIQ